MNRQTLIGLYDANTQTVLLEKGVDEFPAGTDVRVGPTPEIPLPDVEALHNLRCGFEVQRTTTQNSATCVVYEILAAAAV